MPGGLPLSAGSNAAWAPRVLALFGLGLFAFVVRRADPHATARVLIAAGPWLALALCPSPFRCRCRRRRALLGLLGRPVAWTRLLVSLAAEAMLMSVPAAPRWPETLAVAAPPRAGRAGRRDRRQHRRQEDPPRLRAQTLYLALALLSAPRCWRLSRPILGRDGLLPWCCWRPR